MKIVWIVPLSNDRKLELVRASIPIPDMSKDCSEFLQIASDKILEVMTMNAVDHVKVVYGDGLPEYQIIVDVRSPQRSDDLDKEFIRSALMVIVESRSKTKGE